MLFDLQSPGRRRVIKVAYSILAVLFVVGFVGFGVGSDAGVGGIADIFGGGGGGSTDNPFQDDIDAAEERLQQNPQDQVALLELARAHVNGATQAVEIDEETGASIPTPEAGDRSSEAVDAWQRYIETKPAKPDPAVAGQIATAYLLSEGIVVAPDGSGRPAVAFGSPTILDAQSAAQGAAQAQAILAEAQPSQNTYGTLALYRYYAGEIAAAQSAVQQALGEVPAGQRAELQRTFDAYAAIGQALRKEAARAQKAEQAAGAESLEDFGGGLGGGGLSAP